jgi:hypothetical protein
VYVKPSIRSHRVFKATALHAKDGTLPNFNPSPLFSSRHRSVFDKPRRASYEITRLKSQSFKTLACRRQSNRG